VGAGCAATGSADQSTTPRTAGTSTARHSPPTAVPTSTAKTGDSASASQICEALTESIAGHLLSTHNKLEYQAPHADGREGPKALIECGYTWTPPGETGPYDYTFANFSVRSDRDVRGLSVVKQAAQETGQVVTATPGLGPEAFAFSSSVAGGLAGMELWFAIDGREATLTVTRQNPSVSSLESAAQAIIARS
jgi:hypothetical protein